MTKLILLAITLTLLVAFSSARKTVIVRTTIEDDDPSSQKQQQYCSPKLQQESFNQCQMYLQQEGQDEYRQQCCSELQKVDDQQCQCVAVKQVLRDFLQTKQQQQVEQGGGLFGFQKIEKLKQKAQNLPNQCSSQTSRQQECEIGTITTTTIITEDPYNTLQRKSSQQCSQRIPQRFNQCERFIQQALQSRSPRILMKINKQEEQLQKLQQQCCSELENVQDECQCEALQKVYREAIQQKQPPQWKQQGGQIQEVQQVVQALKNQCNLQQVQQCRVPFAMF